jgi:hypothetical protein
MPRISRDGGASDAGQGGEVPVVHPYPGEIVGPDGRLTIAGDLRVRGQILTGSPPNFLGAPAEGIVTGGIQGEGRIIGATACWGLTEAGADLAKSVVNGTPRWVMPANANSTIYATFALEEWWLDSTIGIFAEWVNDHSTTGNVGWSASVKETDIGHEGPATADERVLTLEVQGSPPAGQSTTYILASRGKGNAWIPDPGNLAAYYTIALTRVGSNPADTLEGPVGFVELSYVRGA